MTISKIIIRRTAAVLVPLALAGAVVVPVAASAAPLGGHQAAAAVTGDGSNDHPYTAPCDDPRQLDCTVAFDRRGLNAMSSEYVPAYQCPADHPYLISRNYAPVFTYVPKGVEVDGLWRVGVSITRASFVQHGGSWYANGTTTGFSNSSATNWTFETQSYKVLLHCTSLTDQAWS